MASVSLDESWSESFARYAYNLYGPARFAGHCYEKVTRPDNASTISRIGYLGKALFCSCLAVPFSVLAMPIFLTSRCLRKEEIVKKINQGVSQNIIDEKVKILFINTAAQSGMFPSITAGMPSPYEQFDSQYLSREEAIVAFVEKHQVNIVCISEAHDLASMKKLEKLLSGKDFTNFIKHPPTHPVLVNSGLFVLSKKPISNVEWIPYPFKMRSGVHLGAEQGCIAFDVKEGKKTIRVAATHLNFGKNSHESRKKQLEEVFKKLPKDQTTIFGGDFNYEYMKKMQELKELAAGHDPRKIFSLLPKKTETTRVVFQKGEGIGRKLEGPKEVIDAAILVNGDENEWKAQALAPKVNDEDPYFTDHYGVLVTRNSFEQDGFHLSNL